MNDTELQIIEQLTGVSPDQIKLADDGFWSRGYVIDNGRIVFKNIVYSHGDLGDGNIFVDDGGKVGIIDFSEMCYFDEAGDFMDVSNEELRAAMLDAYGADDALRKKVRLRVLVRPFIVFGEYARRGDTEQMEQLVAKMKELLERGYDRI